MTPDSDLRAIYDSIGDGLFLANPEGRYLDANPAGCAMFGYSVEELRELTVADLIDPSEQGRLDETVRTLGEGDRLRSEWRFRRKDGSTFTGELVGSRLQDGRLQSVVRDITERVERESTHNLLKNEATHRTKNILSLVQAIARQTKGETREDYIARFDSRLFALASSHDLFIKNAWGPIDLRTLIDKQLSAFADDHHSRVSLSGPDLLLKAQAAQAMGMALHEMATNCMKYRAFSGSVGTVALDWSADAEKDTFSMVWRESGGPVVAVPSRQGFGTRLITDITSRAVHGESRIRFEPEGVVWTVECALRGILHS